jgi:hypothetical protein
MKAKKIALIYVNSLIGSITHSERTFNKIVKDLVSEGRVIRSSTSEKIKFEDGTIVVKLPFTNSLVGRRFTHLYIDEQIFELQNGEKYVNEALLPSIVKSGNYAGLDVEGTAKERVKTFSKNGIKSLGDQK